MDKAESQLTNDVAQHLPETTSPFASSSLQDVIKAVGGQPRISKENSNCFTRVGWSLYHFQWSLLLFAVGVLTATCYASGRVYMMGETFKDIMETLKLAQTSINIVDRAVRTTLLVSWLLAGGAVFGVLLNPERSVVCVNAEKRLYHQIQLVAMSFGAPVANIALI